MEPARDGWIGFATVTNAQWQSFAVMSGQPERIDGEWASLKYRLDHPEGARPPITAWTTADTVAEMLEEAADYRVPVAPVVGGADLATIEPFKSKGTFVPSPDGRFIAPRPPYRFSKCALRPPGAAPALDQHDLTGWTSSDPAPAPTTARPFAGLRVVDFSAFWAVPYTTALLAVVGRRRHQGRVDLAPRPHALQLDRRRRRPALVREVGHLRGGERQQAGRDPGARHAGRP